MRIDTSCKQAYREDLYDRTARRFNERTRVGGIDAACEFSQRMLDNLERAVEHPDMTPELAELLSTSRVNLAVRRQAEFDIEG